MKLDELEALAREATPGPWIVGEYDEHLGYDCMTGGVRVGLVTLDGSDYGQRACHPIDPESLRRMMADAHLIAAANPQAILKLCAVVRAASLTPDELDFVLTELKGHGSRDLELECPGCTAYRKLSALRTALSDIGAKE